MRNKEKKAQALTKTKEKKSETLSKAQAKRLEFLGLREKRHQFDQLMYRERRALDEQFGVWSPPPRSPDELEELFFRMFGDLR
jgi:hypothetical protein